MDHRRGIELLDNDRSGQGPAFQQMVALVNGRPMELPLEEHRPVADRLWRRSLRGPLPDDLRSGKFA
jgi:hypothetical protein